MLCGLIATPYSINLGKGDDAIEGTGTDAYTGFSGRGTVFLGEGNDKISGFGEQIVDGGEGYDIAKFDFDSDFSIILGSDRQTLDITPNGVTMTFSNVEQFDFADGSYSYQELVALTLPSSA